MTGQENLVKCPSHLRSWLQPIRFLSRSLSRVTEKVVDLNERINMKKKKIFSGSSMSYSSLIPLLKGVVGSGSWESRGRPGVLYPRRSSGTDFKRTLSREGKEKILRLGLLFFYFLTCRTVHLRRGDARRQHPSFIVGGWRQNNYYSVSVFKVRFN